MIEPSQDLINKDANTERTSSVPTQNSFLPEQKVVEDSIKNYKIIPIKHYKNESYFLYDKSDVIKETFISALNKKYQFMVQSVILIKKRKLKYLK